MMKHWTRIILEVCVTCGVIFGLFWLTNEILLKGRCGAERLIGGIVVGGTIGPVLSLVLIDYLVYRSRRWNWQGTLIAVVLGFAGSVVSLKLSDYSFSFVLWNCLSLASATIPPIAGYHFFMRKEPPARSNDAVHETVGPEKSGRSQKDMP
ncbi:MAG: hypothetical protein NT105_01600 [Verrucomicrobia bacterium]|nr:hypothetical protein [Verrucomicrobiota bacterium]